MLRVPALVVVSLLATTVAAQPAPEGAPASDPATPATPPSEPGEGPAPAAPSLPAPPPFVLGAFVESFWQWNFNRPANGVSNYLAFDNRHNAFTLSNLGLDLQWDAADVVGRVALQVGHTPSTYYASEPRAEGAGGANESSAELWKYVQQANAGYRFHLGARALLVQAGIFLSPIGPESMVVHDNWHWSRSNLFFGLPFYHTGARATLALTEAWSLSLAAYNGWNSVVDNNGRKSLAVQGTYAPSSALSVGLLYFAGVERPRGAPEGDAFRHLVDAHVTYHATSQIGVMAEANAGYEPTELGASAWGAGALSVRFALHPLLALAARGDLLYERVPARDDVRASALFFPSTWVSSATATLDFHPAEHISFRLEYRHDQADAPIYFRGALASPATPDARSQDTLTLGATAWL